MLLAIADAATRTFLHDNLGADGYRVAVAEDHRAALSQLKAQTPDVAVVDLPGESLTLLDAVRGGEQTATGVDPDLPILVLAARAEEIERVRLLDRGADDLGPAPFSYPELRARIAALLRRSAGPARPRELVVGPVRIDLAAREARVGDRIVGLRPKEYELLVTLAAEPGRVFTRDELLREVWDTHSGWRTRTLDSHASRLRARLAQSGAPGLIVNVWGVGYRLDPNGRPASDLSRAATSAAHQLSRR